jgi:group I intron endonuclease
MEHKTMKGYIYKLTSPSNKCYVGQTVNINKRFSEYKTFHHCKNQPKLFNSLKKYG